MRVVGIVGLAAVALGAPVAIVGAAVGDDGGGHSEARADAVVAPAVAPPMGNGVPDGGPPMRQVRRGQQAMVGQPVEVRRQRAREAGEMPPVAESPGPIRAVPPSPPQPPPVQNSPSPPTDIPFNACNRVPAGKRVIKMRLKPDAALPEFVAWISSITCKRFVIPGHISAGGKTLTVVAPGLLTREEAYAAFLNALDLLGLTVEESTSFLRIIETSKAKSSAVPVYGFDGRPAR
jgi:hypothetical protein